MEGWIIVIIGIVVIGAICLAVWYPVKSESDTPPPSPPVPHNSPQSTTELAQPPEVTREPHQQSLHINSIATITLLNNRYEVVKKLKTGGMAVITLARDKKTGQQCVIKTPRTDTAHNPKFNTDKLLMEAAYLRQFDHPGIVKYLDLFTNDNGIHLVEEYIDGENLLTAFARTPAAESRALNWAHQLLDALDYIHRWGMVHRDLTPGNVMLRRNDSVVIIDFGTVKPAAADSGTIVTKPGFQVPEQASRGYSDERSDLFALGGVLFYLLTSQPPGDIGNQDIATCLISKGVSAHTASVIARAMSIDPSLRFPSATDMRQALQQSDLRS